MTFSYLVKAAIIITGSVYAAEGVEGDYDETEVTIREEAESKRAATGIRGK
jgi:hypothetical protein